MEQQIGETSGGNSNQMVDYMLHNTHQQEQEPYVSSSFCSSTSLDKLNFQDVMQFADFGPKLALNQTKNPEEASGIDPIYFLKFPVLNNHHLEQEQEQEQTVMVDTKSYGERGDGGEDERFMENTSRQLRFLGENFEKGPLNEVKNKRKRTRSVKTSEEVESQRMTHIAVERNRRKQMNEHLRVLRSLMPGSYVQRGDQASIIGGAIEFVRELEQLLQCLESQKRRRLYGDSTNTTSVGAAQGLVDQQPEPPFFPVADDQLEGGLLEETAESKSCIADVDVKLLGFDAIIKILSRRRPGQLIKAIAALEDLQLNIIHTNITTIDQTVLYSFTIKVGGETRLTAEDIANSVQQIFTFIHAYNNM